MERCTTRMNMRTRGLTRGEEIAWMEIHQRRGLVGMGLIIAQTIGSGKIEIERYSTGGIVDTPYIGDDVRRCTGGQLSPSH